MALSDDYRLVNRHFTDWQGDNFLSSTVPQVALGSLALGGGARLLKNLIDLGRSDPARSTAGFPQLRSNVTEVPVDVSEEEAEELRRRGIRVKQALAKKAEVQVRNTGPSPLGGLALGTLGTATGMLGWYGADKLIDYFRRRSAKSDVDAVRNRIQRLLEDNPDSEDAAMYGSMKAAEDAYFSQPVSQQKEAAVQDLMWMLPALAGSGLTFNFLSGFNEAKRNSPSGAKAKMMMKYLKERKAAPPQIEMIPVLRKKRKKEQGESPADQAATEPAMF